jgi:hypothetical protein
VSMERSATCRFSAEWLGALAIAEDIVLSGYSGRIAVYNPAMPKV